MILTTNKKDNSDDQYRGFRNHLPKLIAVMLLYLGINSFFKQEYKAVPVLTGKTSQEFAPALSPKMMSTLGLSVVILANFMNSLYKGIQWRL